MKIVGFVFMFLPIAIMILYGLWQFINEIIDAIRCAEDKQEAILVLVSTFGIIMFVVGVIIVAYTFDN